LTEHLQREVPFHQTGENRGRLGRLGDVCGCPVMFGEKPRK
jgi:hypothetical protein